MAKSPQIIIRLEILRGIVCDFSTMIHNFSKMKKKYGVSTDDINKLKLSDSTSLQELTQSLSPKQLGLLIGIVTDFSNLQSRFRNFMNLDQKDLVEFNNQLNNIVKKLDKVLESGKT